MPQLNQEDWEEAFDREFYEGLYVCAESDCEYHDADEAVKAFIRKLLDSKEKAENDEPKQ